ncbi:glycosyltransferase [[Eubacterium] hominis]|uniref:glycosyltransferase n=1 Tax=[Eubacterium] hominis TaxID=2764325 RepID=UPI003A4E0CCC
MERIAFINIVCNGSTGRIMRELQEKANENNFETIAFYGRGAGYTHLNCVKVGNKLSILLHAILSYFLGLHGFGSYFSTKKLIRELNSYKPNVIHLHNIHGYYLNYRVLFNWLENEYKGKVIWTLHDCWSFTGHCAYFTYVGCNSWKTACHDCPEKRKYPCNFGIDNSKFIYNHKKHYFTLLENKRLVLTTPSKWLKDLVDLSFMNKYDVKIINNWVDYNQFKPVKDTSIMKKYNIPEDKKILLGVANVWDDRKGLKLFEEIAEVISNRYVVVLVGLTNSQCKKVPKNIVGVERTENVEELVALYSNARIFLNPSYEETFSLVTIEAMACGVPVIVLNTSAVKELVTRDTGLVLTKLKVDLWTDAIQKVDNGDYSSDRIRKHVIDNYNKEVKIKEFINLFINESEINTKRGEI